MNTVDVQGKYSVLQRLKKNPALVRIYLRLAWLALLLRSKPLSSYIRSHIGWWLNKRSNFKSRREIEIFLRHDWYHDFSPLGLKTNQFKSSFYKLNQKAKQGYLFKMIDRALTLCGESDNASISAVELFCADGFYSNYTASKGVGQVSGVDLDGDSVERRSGVLEQAQLVTRLLGNSDIISFRKADVLHIDGIYDICICAGGLYHMTNPEKLLKKLCAQVKRAMILQTVVSLENDDPTYFVSPAPGLSWGCRFSCLYLEKMLERTGWKIVEKSFNELPGNIRSCDRGSVYMLCSPETVGSTSN